MPRKLTNEEYDKQLIDKKIRVTRIGNYEGGEVKILHRYCDCGCIKLMTPANIKKGNRCYDCSIVKQLTTEKYKQQLIDKDIKVEVLEPYINDGTKIWHNFTECDCPKILISPSNVKRGVGCGHCKSEKISKSNLHTMERYKKDLIKREILNVEVLEEYRGDAVKIWHNFTECDCPKIKISPSEVKQGRGCGHCRSTISKISGKWLDEIEKENNIILEREYKFCGNRFYKADGYHKGTNTIYEFYGDYWHGNPRIKYFVNNEFCKKRYQETIEKEYLIKKLGYNLITIWESDYKKLINQ